MDKQDRARTLLADEFFSGVVESQREMYIKTILNSQEDDIDTRERTIVKLRALDEFIATLESFAKQGEIEKKRWKIF